MVFLFNLHPSLAAACVHQSRSTGFIEHVSDSRRTGQTPSMSQRLQTHVWHTNATKTHLYIQGLLLFWLRQSGQFSCMTDTQAHLGHIKWPWRCQCTQGELLGLLSFTGKYAEMMRYSTSQQNTIYTSNFSNWLMVEVKLFSHNIFVVYTPQADLSFDLTAFCEICYTHTLSRCHISIDKTASFLFFILFFKLLRLELQTSYH